MTSPQVVTPECFNRGPVEQLPWIPAKHMGDGLWIQHYAVSCRWNSMSRMRHANGLDESIEQPPLFGGKTHKRRQQ
jgi:hypothetical protein